MFRKLQYDTIQLVQHPGFLVLVNITRTVFFVPSMAVKNVSLLTDA